MKDQGHVRNAETAQLAQRLARQTDMTISDIVLEALRQQARRVRAGCDNALHRPAPRHSSTHRPGSLSRRGRSLYTDPEEDDWRQEHGRKDG
ncbi:MAG: type II toxin-antitoxin system VapB family antitoxin [Burkholderiales bacterium]|nr:type II toxin-antitoxin system VapB family antitoxin [Burkholderiales bacterium]